MGKRGKAKKTKQLGHTQRAILTRLLVIREVAKRGYLEDVSPEEVNQHGVPYRLLGSSYDLKDFNKSLPSPFGGSTKGLDLTGNLPRAATALEERGLITCQRSKGGHRTHVLLTKSGARKAKALAFLPMLQREVYDHLLKRWVGRHGAYEGWDESRKARLKAEAKEISGIFRNLSRDLSKTVGGTWKTLRYPDFLEPNTIYLFDRRAFYKTESDERFEWSIDEPIPTAVFNDSDPDAGLTLLDVSSELRKEFNQT